MPATSKSVTWCIQPWICSTIQSMRPSWKSSVEFHSLSRSLPIVDLSRLKCPRERPLLNRHYFSGICPKFCNGQRTGDNLRCENAERCSWIGSGWKVAPRTPGAVSASNRCAQGGNHPWGWDFSLPWLSLVSSSNVSTLSAFSSLA